MTKANLILPPRLADPLYRSKTYVARRSGLEDPAQRARLQRIADRQPQPRPRPDDGLDPRLGSVTELIEDFDGGTLTSGQIGRNGFGLSVGGTGNLTQGNSTAGHPGTVVLGTGGTNGSTCSVYHSIGGMLIDDHDEVEFIVNTRGAITATQQGVFLTDNLNLAGSVIGVIADASLGHTTWRSYKDTSGGAAVIGGATGVNWTASTWYSFLFKRVASGSFTITIIGGGQIDTVSISGLDTGPQYFAQARVTNQAAAIKELEWDFYRRRTSPLTRV